MRASLLRILSLVRKEFLALLRDPRSRVILFAPALIQTVIFGYAASFDLNHAPYAVVDEDRSAASRDLLAPGRVRRPRHAARDVRGPGLAHPRSIAGGAFSVPFSGSTMKSRGCR